MRLKYGCLQCLKTKADTVDHVDDTPGVIAIAPPVPHVIPKCSAEPGLLAQIIVNKFTDHLPLARQEAIFARQGIRIPRQTISTTTRPSGASAPSVSADATGSSREVMPEAAPRPNLQPPRYSSPLNIGTMPASGESRK